MNESRGPSKFVRNTLVFRVTVSRFAIEKQLDCLCQTPELVNGNETPPTTI